MAKKKTPTKTRQQRIQIVEDVVDPATGAETTIESPTEEVSEMATKKKAAPKKGTTKKKVSGSQLVRDYWTANPAATQAEIAKATGVHPSQVSQVLKREKEKAGVAPEGQKRGRKAAAPVASNGHSGADQVIGFLTTAAEIGIDKSIELLQKIRSGISKTPF